VRSTAYLEQAGFATLIADKVRCVEVVTALGNVCGCNVACRLSCVVVVDDWRMMMMIGG
jgi:hypothetical protein